MTRKILKKFGLKIQKGAPSAHPLQQTKPTKKACFNSPCGFQGKVFSEKNNLETEGRGGTLPEGVNFFRNKEGAPLGAPSSSFSIL
jgi:hypothetical protein